MQTTKSVVIVGELEYVMQDQEDTEFYRGIEVWPDGNDIIPLTDLAEPFQGKRVRVTVELLDADDD